MAVNCDPNALLDAAKCFRCIPDGMQAPVQTFLLAVIAGGSTDPEVLMQQAACFRCADGMHQEIQTMLLCQITNK
jgi:hypothetical protein